MLTSVTSNLSLTLSQFNQGKEIKAYERDGKQQTYLSALLYGRVALLNQQWLMTGKTTIVAPIYVGLAFFITKLVFPLIRIPVAHMQRGCFTPIAKGMLTGLGWIEKGMDIILNHTGIIINTACLVSYVAMICLGSPLMGAFGLVGLALILVKQLGYMPGIVEKVLLPFELVSQIVSAIISPVGLFLKIVGLLFNSFSVLNYLSRNEALHRYLPKCIFDETIRYHSILFRPNQNWESRIDGAFSLNYSSLHSDRLKEILPPTETRALSKIKVEDLYQTIDARIKQLKITIDQDGWKRMRTGVEKGRVQDVMPMNFARQRELLKALLNRISLEEDDAKFKSQVEQLAKIGSSCVEGWLRDVSFMLNPKAKTDIAWVIHHHLAVYRSELIRQGIEKANRKLHEKTRGQFTFNVVGGGQNVHLSNQVQMALHHLWRPYEGEVTAKCVGRSFLVKLLQKGSAAEKVRTTWNRIKDAWIAMIHITLPIPMPTFLFTRKIDNFMIKHYKVPEVIDSVVQGTRHTYGEIRNIEWETIRSWFISLAKREIVSVEDYDNSSLVAKDDFGTYSLSERGVKLLLWDLGIIQPVSV